MKVDLTARADITDKRKFFNLSQDKQRRIQERMANTYIIALKDAGIDINEDFGKQGVVIALVHPHNVHPDGTEKTDEEAEQYPCEPCMGLAQDGEV